MCNKQNELSANKKQTCAIYKKLFARNAFVQKYKQYFVQ